jgi:hypothetical protein
MNADPELNARRIAGLRKAKATPQNRKRASAWAKKLWANPAHRERRSSTMKSTWADLRAARAAQTRAANTRKGPGAPKKDERDKRILELRRLHPDWKRRDIAREIEPDFAKDPDGAIGRIKSAEYRMKSAKKQETRA